MLYVSVCGSDIHVCQRDSDGYAASSVPARGWEQPKGIILGHEFAGRIVAHGPQAHRLPLGALVASESLVPCRRCAICRQGQPNQCPRASLLGLERDGVFAEYATVPAASLHSLAPLVKRYGQEGAVLRGCQAEPLGVAATALAEGLRRLVDRSPRSLLVFGCGPIGTYVLALGKVLGFRPVVGIEPHARRRVLAEQTADHVFDLTDWNGPARRELFGQGPALVVECSGQADPATVFASVRPGGVVVTLARTGRLLEVPLDELITRGVTLVGTRGQVGSVSRVIHWMGAGRLDPLPFLTRRLEGLEELVDWLQHPDQFAGEGKVVCQIGR